MALLVDLNAIKDKGLRADVLGAVFILASAPFGWFEVIEPTVIWGTMISVFVLLTGKNIIVKGVQVNVQSKNEGSPPKL
jgi:hypothetical protein